MTDSGAGAVFALLDDCDSTALARSSRLYTGFVREHASSDPAALESLCAQVVADQRLGLHALVLGDYEFGRALHGSARGDGQGLPPGGISCETASRLERERPATLRILMFSRCEKLSREEADAWLARCEADSPCDAAMAGQSADAAHETLAKPGVAGIANVVKSVTREQFDAAIDAIHAALRAGDSYQVNYTYRLGFDAYGSPVALYRRLRMRQPVRYGALIALPGDAWVLSCSPELFIEKTGAQLRTRPMKGTAPRDADPARDQHIAKALAADAKNRAENLMIVDLLRNDVSRVARIGSVRTPALFSVEPYRSVWQMTSTVEAELREGASFADIVRALFPCGSITGAPKHRTMALIDELESTPRGLYTGMIGWLDAVADASSGKQAGCGDFCLSVVIRTLTLEPRGQHTARRGEMGVGAGIVLDSMADDEYAECELKAGFLTEADPGFQLFETMYATPGDGMRYSKRHLARLRDSARVLGFRFDECAVLDQIEAHEIAIEAEARQQGAARTDAWRVRLALAKDGALELTHARLAPLSTPVKLMLAHEHGFAPLDASDLLLHHKTTRRAEYDRAWKLAEQHGAFDMVFLNQDGELAEGGRSNVFVKLDGRWYTPPLSAGVLPGVMRGVLLEDTDLQASERALTLDDLRRAEAVLLSNALRGAVAADVVFNGLTT